MLGMPATQGIVGGSVRKPLDDEIDVYGLTHAGKVRAQNQDHFLIGSLHKSMRILSSSFPTDPSKRDTERLAFLMMVADGVGSTIGGEEASRLTLEEVTRYVTHSSHCFYTADPSDDNAFIAELQQAAWRCHDQLIAEHDPGSVTRATTLTLLLGVWPRAYLLQVGDSRYYLMRGDELTQVSRDQTLAQDLVDAGVFTRGDRAVARLSNVLSSAIGGTQASPVVLGIANGWDRVHLLCSDGLTKHVSDEQIAERLRTMTSSKQVCEALLQDALDAGGSDNITILVGRAIKKHDD